MESFDGVAEVKRIKKNLLWKQIISGVFFCSSIVFLIVYLTIPQAKVRSLHVETYLKGTQKVFSESDEMLNRTTLISRNDIINGLGLTDDTYSAFIDVKKAALNLKNADFVCDKIEPVVTKTPFSLKVSFADLFPIVSIDEQNYLTDGNLYPVSSADNTEKEDWILNHYPDKKSKLVPFLDDPSLGDDHSTSIPNLFYAWELLEKYDPNSSLGLRGIRYDASSGSYLFYWKSESEPDLNLRVRLDKDLLFDFSHENRILEIDKLTNGSFSDYKMKSDEFVPKFKDKSLKADGWYTLVYKISSDGVVSAKYENKEA